MQITYSFEEEFDVLWSMLKCKYPKKMFEIDGESDEQLDSCEFAKGFFKSRVTADSSVDPNANISGKTAVVFAMESDKPSKRLNSLYLVWKELRRLYGSQVANGIIEAQINGSIYINDLHGIASGLPYCFNYSTYDIMTQGLSMVEGVLPPKYLMSFKAQVEQFVAIATNSTLGATGLADMLVVMSYYAKNALETLTDDKFRFKAKEDVWNYIESLLVSFIYTVNQPYRCGVQSPFTNISVYDINFLQKLKEDYIFPDGSTPDIEIVQKLQEIFIDCMNTELRRSPMTFPVTTACFSVDNKGNILDLDFLDFISKKNLEFGFINIYCGDKATLSSCCRLRSEQSSEYFNSFGSGSSKIGSLGVCTINLPRIAYKSIQSGGNFFDNLKNHVKIASMVNNAKRYIIKKRIKNGNHPLYDLGFMDIDKQYSTVGIIGFNECIDILNRNILTESGVDLGLKIIEIINAENDKYEKQYQAPHNCEQIPGETVAVKLALKDKILGYNKDYLMYSNQFIPLLTNADMLERIELQGRFDKHFSGGSICHLNVETKLEDPKLMAELIKIAAQKGVIYFAINYNIQRCENNHMSVGKKSTCSVCGGKITDNFTRVVGFLTNTKNWNKTRREVDYPNRVFYHSIE